MLLVCAKDAQHAAEDARHAALVHAALDTGGAGDGGQVTREARARGQKNARHAAKVICAREAAAAEAEERGLLLVLV